MNCATYALLRLTLLHFLCELRENGQNITNNAEVSNRKDGRMLIFVDRYNVFGAYPFDQFDSCKAPNQHRR